MVGEFVDDALELVVDLLVQQAQLVRILQVFLNEFKQLVAHFTVNEKGKQVLAQRVGVIVLVHRASSCFSLFYLSSYSSKAAIIRAVKLEPSILALGDSFVHVVQIEFYDWQFGEEVVDLCIL